MGVELRGRPACLALSCVSLMSAFGRAEAQTVAPPADEPGPTELQGVTVTSSAIDGSYAQEPTGSPKFTASLLNTPRSIEIVPETLIRDTGSTTLEEALRTVPGITFGAAEGGNPLGDRPFIRGFDTEASTYLDGVRDLGSQTRETFDIDQIQVIRGSDSVIGGRGSAGGTINIISKLPTDTNSIAVDASLGNADYERATIDVNRKLTDTIAVRLAAMAHHQDVAGRDAIWQKRWGVAPSITVGLGTPTRATLGWYHLHQNELPDSGIPYQTVCSSTICNAPLGSSLSYPAHSFTTVGGQSGTVPRDAFYGLKDRDFRRTDTDQGTARLEHDFGGDWTLHNTFRYSRTSQDYIYTQPDDSQGDVVGTSAASAATAGGYIWRRANTRFGSDRSYIDALDLTGKFATGPLQHSIAAGGELAWENARRGAYVLSSGSTISPRCSTVALTRAYCTSVFAPNPDDTFVNYTSDTGGTPTPIVRGSAATETLNRATTRSAYLFDTITITPSLLVNLGGRVDRFHSTQQLPVIGTGRPEVSRTDTLFTGQAGLVYKPTRDTSLYVSYATAATPPNSVLGEGREDNSLGTAPTGTTPATLSAAQAALQQAADLLKVQKTRTYEAGAKASVLGERLSLTAAVFRTETVNARVTGADNTAQFIGRTRVQGVELGFNGNLTERWNVYGGYSYLDAIITDGGFTATTNGVTVIAPSINTGKRVPQTAKHSASLFTTYKLTSRFSLGGGAFYNSRVYGGYGDNRTVQNGQLVITRWIARAVPGYVRLDGFAEYKLGPHWDLRVNAQNLTDKRYFSQAYTSHYATEAAGRTVFATIGLRY